MLARQGSRSVGSVAAITLFRATAEWAGVRQSVVCAVWDCTDCTPHCTDCTDCTVSRGSGAPVIAPSFYCSGAAADRDTGPVRCCLQSTLLAAHPALPVLPARQHNCLPDSTTACQTAQLPASLYAVSSYYSHTLCKAVLCLPPTVWLFPLCETVELSRCPVHHYRCLVLLSCLNVCTANLGQTPSGIYLGHSIHDNHNNLLLDQSIQTTAGLHRGE